MNIGPEWTTQRTDLLRQHWNAKLLSASQIARILGMTRNAVIGKAHRLELEQRNPVDTSRIIDRRAKQRAQPRLRIRPMMIEQHKPPPLEPPPSNPVALFDLKPEHCRWPLWNDDVAEKLFCGAVKADGSAYCSYHEHKAFVRRG
jgi:GcrA cell cycle regulator